MNSKYDMWQGGGLFSEQLRDVEEGLSQFASSSREDASLEQSKSQGDFSAQFSESRHSSSAVAESEEGLSQFEDDESE